MKKLFAIILCLIMALQFVFVNAGQAAPDITFGLAALTAVNAVKNADNIGGVDGAAGRGVAFTYQNSGAVSFKLKMTYATPGNMSMDIFDNGMKIGILDVPASGGWASYTDTPGTMLTLNPGTHNIKILTNSVRGCNISKVIFTNITSETVDYLNIDPVIYNGINLSVYGGAKDDESGIKGDYISFLNGAGRGFYFTYNNTTGKNLVASVSMNLSSANAAGSTPVTVKNQNDVTQANLVITGTANWNIYANFYDLATIKLNKGENTIYFTTTTQCVGYNVKSLTLSKFIDTGALLTGISVANGEYTINQGETLTFSAITASYDDDTTKEVTDYAIKSSLPSIATVSGTTVTGVKGGTTMITFTYQGESTKIPLTVISNTPQIKLNKFAYMTNSGKISKITATTDLVDSLTWTSSNPSVATVDNSGNVTALSKGDATITASGNGAAATCIVSVDYEGQNPLLPPTWGLFIADGEPHIFNGIAYVYGSKDNPKGYTPSGSRNWCDVAYHVIYSEDLINWTDAGESLNLADIPEEMTNGAIRLWAPDCFKDPNSDKYYLTACTNSARMIITESNSPTGPFTNPRVMTNNGSPISAIDPGVLVDDDGKIYFAGPNFWIAQLDPTDYSKTVPETWTNVRSSMSTDYVPYEGPSLRKRGDTYYYIYIQDAGPTQVNMPTRMAYMTSKSPLGPYTYQGLIVTNYNYMTSGNIHGSITQFNGEWYAFYHMAYAEFELTRTMFADKLKFNEDGTIKEVIKTSSGIKGSFRLGEKIRASSGVDFLGGRGDNRLTARYENTANQYVLNFTDYPFAYFSQEGQYIGYRYVNFAKGADELTISIRTSSDNGELSVKNGLAGAEIAKISLPNTNGQWQTITAPVIGATGVSEVYLYLTKKPTGNVDIDWFTFSADTYGFTKEGNLLKITNMTDNEKQMNVIVAGYGENNSLLWVKVTPVTGTTNITKTVDIPEIGDANSVKAFLFCSESIKPLSESIIIKSPRNK